MNKKLKNALILTGVGFIIGLAIGIFMIYIQGGQLNDFTGRDIFMLFVGGLQGAIPMGLTVVYDIEDWSILRSTVTHFIPTMIVFYACSYYMGWLKFGTTVFWITTVMMIHVKFWMNI